MYDLAHNYCFCLDSDKERNQKAFLLLLELEVYVNGAIMQTTRLARSRKAIDKRLREKMDSVRQAKYVHKSSKKDFSLNRHFLSMTRRGMSLPQKIPASRPSISKVRHRWHGRLIDSMPGNQKKKWNFNPAEWWAVFGKRAFCRQNTDS